MGRLSGLEKRMGGLEVVGGQRQPSPAELVDDGAAVPLRKTFEFQSYYDSTALDRALRVQNPAEPIVASSLLSSTDGITPDNSSQAKGYGLGLHPASQTPVAVQLLGNGGKSKSSVVILKPGQTYFPGGAKGFEGIIWGLPFGWLGGGSAYLMVFKTRETFKAWPGNPEVVFHRQRMLCYLGSNTLLTLPRPNWPLRFPWPAASSANVNTSGSPQKGLPLLGVVPTMVVVRARAALAAANSVRFLFVQTDDLDLKPSTLSAGVVTGAPDVPLYDAFSTSGTGIQETFPIMVNSGFQINGVAAKEFPELVLDNKVLRVGGDNCVCIPIDVTGGLGTNAGAAVLDVCRYGTIG